MAAAGVLVVPFATGAGPSPSPIPQGCRLRSPQPEAPLKLNLVAVGDLVKAIAMEKEVFECYDARSTLTQLKDVETFIEIVRVRTEAKGKGGTAGLKTTAIQVDVATCTKDLVAGRVACRTDALPVGTTSAPLARCSVNRGTYPFPPVEQPTHPVEMASVRVDRLVDTVKVEKEVFDCAGRIADLYLFTERVEEARDDTFRSVENTFRGIVCFKDEPRGAIAECRAFQP
jgi:hypothetical protein